MTWQNLKLLILLKLSSNTLYDSTSYRNRTSWLELPSPSEAHRSTTSSDGMWVFDPARSTSAPRLCVISPTHCRFPAPSNDYRVYTANPLCPGENDEIHMSWIPG